MKKKIIFMGVLGLLLPFNAKALSGTGKITCDKTKLNPGETTTCTVKVNSPDEFTSINFNINTGENLTFVEFKQSNTWVDLHEAPLIPNEVDVFTSEWLTGEITVGTFSVKAGNNVGVTSSISLSEVTMASTDAEGNDSNTTFNVEPISIRIPSNVNTLSMIKINDENITNFSSNKYNYQFDTDYSNTSIKISATATDSSSTISGDIGNKNISYGTNKFTIKVKSESGAEKEYVINVIKREGRELKSLKLNDTEITLEAGKYNYNLEVENKVDKILIDATLNNDKTSFVDKFGKREETLKVGNNEILVKTKDTNNEELTYKITVNRLNAKGESIAPVDKEDKEDKNENKNPENPKTGVKVSIMVCILGIIIGAISFVVVRKKNYFKKI